MAPGLRPFGTDFGNGKLDQELSQLDSRLDEFLQNKRDCLAERPSKYVQRRDLPRGLEDAVCRLLGRPFGEPIGSLDEIALRVPEDIAVVWEGRCVFLHLCAPSHWAAEDKIGRTFFAIHEEIPGFEPVNRAADALVDAMVRQGPFVRFVWGVESDDRLNHHPVAPLGWDQAVWWGRQFAPDRPFWARTERQVIWGFPEFNAALFTIRVGHVSGEDILADEHLRSSLAEALRSMSPESQAYKGVAEGMPILLDLLDR